jgi:ribosomal protein S18 acetylase RimI-like enzyme
VLRWVADPQGLATPDRLAIRRLERHDASDFRLIRLAALQAEPQAYGSTYEAERLRPLTAFEERVANAVVLGAYRGERIIGMVGLKQEEGARDRHKGFIWGMFVDSTERRQGVATALIEALIEQARLMIEQVTLTVVSDNLPAIDLYRRFGFASYGIEPKALKSADRYSDELLMIKFLIGAD